MRSNAKREDGWPHLPFDLLARLPFTPGPMGRRCFKECPAYSAASAIGLTDTYVRPLAFVRKDTEPFTVAKIVWSLPRPTLAPGCHFVPRWRTMMLPASTAS